MLSHDDYALWHTITDQAISPDGNFVGYSLERGEKDSFLKLTNAKGAEILSYDRGKKAAFSYDSKHLIFTITAWKDSIIAMKRRKVKKKDLPSDSLGVFDMVRKELMKIANVESYKLPEKWSGYMPIN